MSSLYTVFRWLARRWLLFAVVLIGATFVSGLYGFAREQPENSLPTNAYLVLLLFTLNSNEVAGNVGWELEVTRWLGVVVWGFTLGTILIRLFAQPTLVLFVAACAGFRRGHVIVAGLGRPETERDRLVERLRAQGKDVVVIEPDAEHAGLETCRQAGAICLIGSPLEPTMMGKARLSRAGTLLALSEDDRKNVSLLTLTASVLGAGAGSARIEDEDPLARTKPENVVCVVQVSEPRLLEVLRRHDLHRDPTDRLHLRIFNMHEMVARTMLRECLIGRQMPELNKVLLVGTGAEGRLGEALVLRAAKDHFIDAAPGQPIRPLEIHVFDPQAASWVKCVQGDFDKDLEHVCRLVPTDLASRCGFRGLEQREEILKAGYDAVFICMSHEPHAMIQAAQLREVLPAQVPIIVRVHEETAAFGQLLQQSNAGGLGSNIHIVGTHDRVFDIVASMNPAVEMVAQVLHQDYLLLTQRRLRAAEVKGDLEAAAKIARKAAFVPWRKLAEEYRASNRALAQRLREHLTVPAGQGQPLRRFQLKFSPRELIAPHELFPLSPDELEALTRQEHDLWCRDVTALGWRKGSGQDPHSSDPVHKLNPNLVPWDELDEGMKDYDRNIIRRLPHVFAKADYKVESVN